MQDLIIRPAKIEDAQAMLDIYSYYVEHTAISFEYDVPSLEEFTNRLNSYLQEYACFVALIDEQIIGYAYGSKHRYRTAYQWSLESTIYLDSNFHSKGIAKKLYHQLFAELKNLGYYNVYAGVALPNPKSEFLHKSMGFREIGIFRNIGYKFDKWHDVMWLELFLQEHQDNPQIPVKLQK